MKQSQIWHHGLVALSCGVFETEGGKEAAYFQKLIKRSGQPALDLGCGTDRLLLPLLQAGLELEIVARTVATDPLDEVSIRQIRARLWRQDELIKEEIHTQKLDDYSKNELVLMLERAGFAEIAVHGDYTDEPAKADHNNLLFLANKRRKTRVSGWPPCRSTAGRIHWRFQRSKVFI